MEREEEEERRRRSGGNKLENEKEANVQSLGEKTLKCDYENGMKYHGVRGLIRARIKGGFLGSEEWWGEMLRVYGVST